MPKNLPLTSLVADDRLQQRQATFSDEAVADYVDTIQRGDKLPPIDVFDTPDGRLIADGFQRFKAHEKAGKSRIACTIHEGDFADAELFSIGANKSHGLRRTNADKRRAVEAALRNEKSKGWSDRRIAKHVGVSPDTVNRLRGQVSESDTSTTRTGADGKQYPPSKAPSKPKSKAVGNGRPAAEPPEEADSEPLFDTGKQGVEGESDEKDGPDEWPGGFPSDDEFDLTQFLLEIRSLFRKWSKRCPDDERPDISDTLRELAGHIDQGRL